MTGGQPNNKRLRDLKGALFGALPGCLALFAIPLSWSRAEWATNGASAAIFRGALWTLILGALIGAVVSFSKHKRRSGLELSPLPVAFGAGVAIVLGLLPGFLLMLLGW